MATELEQYGVAGFIVSSFTERGCRVNIIPMAGSGLVRVSVKSRKQETWVMATDKTVLGALRKAYEFIQEAEQNGNTTF